MSASSTETSEGAKANAISLQSDIVGRVNRLGLKPSEKTSLLPLQEAMSNALHAIDDKFGVQAAALGRIEIELIFSTRNKYQTLEGFLVKDNGIGLGPEQFDAFCKPDTVHKIQRGGKGVGRLVWLKTFNSVSIKSVFEANNQRRSRSFNFVLANNNQIRSHKIENTESVTGTEVTLRGFDPLYANRCPINPDSIAKHLVSHFMPVLAAGTAPSITLIVEGVKHDLNKFFADNVVEKKESDFVIDSDSEQFIIRIRHIKCNKSIRGTKNFNNLLLCAHGRSVLDASIDQALGLKSLDGEYVYIGCVSGEVLDSSVNQERTDFFITEEDKINIRRSSVDQAKTFLEDYVSEVVKRKREAAEAVINNNPQYMYLRSELDEFVGNLSPAVNSREDILIEMARHRYRKSTHIHRIQEEIKENKAWTEEISQKVEELTKLIDDDQKGVLAEYVLKRRAILDILDQVRQFDESGRRKYPLEDAVHQLICPMRTDSTKLSIEDHNLWVIDDRLALSEFFWSDRPFKSTSDVDSLDRVDILFSRAIGMRPRNGAAGSHVIIEFKRPGRDDYTPNDSPMRQVLKYVKQLQTARTFTGLNGGVFTAPGERARFECYIIADLTETLYDVLTGFGQPTSDGRGWFYYATSPTAYVEIIPYEKLFSDAKLRNAIFFDKLNLPST